MKLKKILVLALLALGIFGGCLKGGVAEVSKLEFKLDDGNVPEQYYSEVQMTVVPDYEKRTLTVDYSRVFPKRTAETVDEDIQIKGVTIGGENFERFLKSVDYVTKFKSEEAIVEEDAKAIFYARAYPLGDGEPQVVAVNWNSEGSADEDLEALKSFYLDVANLLTENEPV